MVRGGRSLIRVHLDTLAEDVVYLTTRLGQLWHLGRQQRLHQARGHRDRQRTTGFPLSDWTEEVREMFLNKPRCRLIRIDLASGERTVIHEEKLWLGHPLYRPWRRQHGRVLPRRPAT